MYYRRGMKTVADICDALGRKNMEVRLGVSKAAISNAVSDGVFPAAWYAVISEMCVASEIECPLPNFSFRRAADPDGQVDLRQTPAA